MRDVRAADVLENATWFLRRVDPAQEPGDALAAGIPARIPGTVSGALRDALGEDAVAGVLAGDGPETVWEFRTTVTTAGGPHRFTSEGVATVSELLVAGRVAHTSGSAFAPWEVTAELPAGPCEVVLRVLPTTGVAVPRKPRARWLSPLVPDRSYRWRRTPLVGAIDWPGALPVLGPWGGLRASAVPAPPSSSPSEAGSARPGSGTASRPPGAPAARTRVLEDGRGLVTVGFAGTGSGGVADSVRITVETAPRSGAGEVVAERTVTAAEAAGCATVALTVPEPRLWWPHGAGEQPLYRVRVRTAGSEHVTRVGFRTVTAEARDGDHRGLALRVNGVPVFVRGAVWTGADPFEVAADPQRTRAMLLRLRAGGATMLRIPGTSCYETEDFHRLCDELGVMVWQDVALGPLDAPDDPDWRAGLRDEVHALASRLAPHPSTAVVSGGTEVVQAPVLAGRPAEQWVADVLVNDIPGAVGEAGADVVVVPSSPCSDEGLDAARDAWAATFARWQGAEAPAAGERAASSSGVPRSSPVDAADGVSHYFGVGAYGRPIEDAVTRGVRFAAESLTFGVPPEPAVVRAQFGTDAPLDHEPSAERWREGIAHDPGAAWTFSDTTMLYVRRVFLDRDSDPDAGLAVPARPAPERALTDHARRLEYERAALAHVFQRTLAQWRSRDSTCRGALVLSAASTAPGAGWGVLDVTGRPTAAWYGMRRACAPVAVSFVPAGGDGLPVHVWNDAPEPLSATLRLTVATVRGGCQAPLDLPVTVPAHGELVLRADLADGTFRDLDNAYGFGEREYDAVSAVLLSGTGEVLARDAHLSGGPRRYDPVDPGLDAHWVHTADGAWHVAVTATSLARFVALDLPVDAPSETPDTPVAEDGYVHVLPGETVVIPVSGAVTATVRAATTVRALETQPAPVRAG